MSYCPEMLVDGKWVRNALRFATKEEALYSAHCLFMRWMVPTDYRATEVDAPVNHRIDAVGAEVRLEE